MRQAIGRALHLAAPTFGWCYRCLIPWKFCDGHSTRYSASSGCFPLCENCWSELSAEQRLPFYEQLCNAWGSDADERTAIRSAVLTEGMA